MLLSSKLTGNTKKKRSLYMYVNLSRLKHEIQHGTKILNEGHSKTTPAENLKYSGIYCG